MIAIEADQSGRLWVWLWADSPPRAAVVHARWVPRGREPRRYDWILGSYPGQDEQMNYDIHGDTIPDLHMHLFPRSAGDVYMGYPRRRSAPTALR